MLITTKLSREFYERFGDTIVNEMIDLFNRIDEGSRLELRALNEHNASRVESRIDQRSARLEALLEQRTAELRSDLVTHAARLDSRIDALTSGVAALETAVKDLSDGIAAFPVVLEKALHAQTRWMLGMWGIMMAALVATWFR